MKRIRVLHSELNGELGGIESFLYNVYRFIDKEKVEFDFLTISDTPAYGDKFKKMGSTVYKVPKHINFLGYYFAIDKILREGNYDIVHIHKNSAIDILILKVLQRFPNIKVVVHSHNTFPSVGGKLEKLHKFNRKYLYDNADYRLACSDNAGKWMYGNGAFEIIKNGIYLMKASSSGCVWWNSKGLVCIDPSWFKMAATLFDLEISIPTANIDIPSFVSIYGYPAFPKYAHIQS